MNETDLNENINQLEDNNQELREKIVTSTAEMQDQQAEFKELQLLCEDLQLDFKGAHFTPKVATSMSYDEHTQFNEGNITAYLAELEEYIASLIEYTAHKQGDPHAAVSSVPFGQLNSKDWLARDMAIDPAFDITVHTAADSNTEAEEEETTDIHLLYKKFHEKMDQNLIQGNRKADQKTNKDMRDD